MNFNGVDNSSLELGLKNSSAKRQYLARDSMGRVYDVSVDEHPEPPLASVLLEKSWQGRNNLDPQLVGGHMDCRGLLCLFLERQQSNFKATVNIN